MQETKNRIKGVKQLLDVATRWNMHQRAAIYRRELNDLEQELIALEIDELQAERGRIRSYLSCNASEFAHAIYGARAEHIDGLVSSLKQQLISQL